MSELAEYIKTIKREHLEKSHEMLLMDSADTDNYVRNRVKDILTDFQINGDSYGVPSVEDIVDRLCEIIEEKNTDNEK